MSATAEVDVSQVVVSLVISPPDSTLHELGQTLQFAAEVRDAEGHAIPSAEVIWASSDSDCVAIDEASGLATALSDTTMELFAISAGQPAVLLMENDDWQTNANAAEIASLTANRTLADLEAALLTNLNSGAYTAMVRDFGNDQSGVRQIRETYAQIATDDDHWEIEARDSRAWRRSSFRLGSPLYQLSNTTNSGSKPRSLACCTMC